MSSKGTNFHTVDRQLRNCLSRDRLFPVHGCINASILSHNANHRTVYCLAYANARALSLAPHRLSLLSPSSSLAISSSIKSNSDVGQGSAMNLCSKKAL